MCPIQPVVLTLQVKHKLTIVWKTSGSGSEKLQQLRRS